MIEFILEILFQSAQNPGISGLTGAEFVVALGVGLLGYKIFTNVGTPTENWENLFKALGIFLMAVGAVDILFTVFRLF